MPLCSVNDSTGIGALSIICAFEPWAGLIDPFSIYQEDLARLAESCRLNEGAEELLIDRGSQNPGGVPIRAKHCDDKVGHLAISQKHIANVDTLCHDLFEPKRFGIVLIQRS